MGAERSEFMTNAEIARACGVRPAAVSLWRKRSSDFPTGVVRAGRRVYPIDDLLAWLSDREVPADVRRRDEPPGTTYADRLRADNRVESPVAITTIMWSLADRLRGDFDIRNLDEEWRLSLLWLIYLRGCHPERFEVLATGGPKFDDVLRSEFPGSWGAGHAFDRDTLIRVAGAVRHALYNVRRRDVAAQLFDGILNLFQIQDGRLGETVTPHRVAALAVALTVDADTKRIHDPMCRMGEMLVAAASRATQPTVSGGDLNERSQQLADMRLQLHGVAARMSRTPDFSRMSAASDRERVDVVVTNPPFNIKHWTTSVSSPIWRYGAPPKSNANFAWLQYALDRLDVGGRACVVMSNNAASSQHGTEQMIRRRMLEDGAVEGIIALPANLFLSTGIPVSLWLLRYPTGRSEDVLLMDVRDGGTVVARGYRELTTEDVDWVTQEWRSWRRSVREGRQYTTVPGSTAVVAVTDIINGDGNLSPGRYVGVAHPTKHASPPEIARLLMRTWELRARAAEVDERLTTLLAEFDG